MMTVEDILKRVERIRNSDGDNEDMHFDEDVLWENVLEAIARGAPNAPELAQAALRTKELKFTRWYA